MNEVTEKHSLLMNEVTEKHNHQSSDITNVLNPSRQVSHQGFTFLCVEWRNKAAMALTLKAPITNAAEDKFYFFPNFRKK